jgi:ABC-type antimicrobial peptide transport system permease subunit
LIGALLGYVLGYLPSTLMSMGESAGQIPSAEPPQWLVLVLASGLGAVAGAVLSFAQWLVLRGKAQRAVLWIPANMLAWALGMPVIFQTMDWAFRMPALWESALVVAAGLFIAGAIVGAVHGRFLLLLTDGT